jgi:exodeoxyribonuclease-5
VSQQLSLRQLGPAVDGAVEQANHEARVRAELGLEQAEALAAPPSLGKLPDARVSLINQRTTEHDAKQSSVTVKDLSPDQRAVYDKVLRWFETRLWETNPKERIFTLGGLAGTGKTTVLSLLLKELAVERRKLLAVMTPTGKASTVLARKLGRLVPFCAYLGTIHGFMYTPIVNANEELTGWGKRYFEKQGDTYVAKGGKIPRLDMLVVDESSMLNRELESDLEAFKMPILAVGDHGQLPPVQGKNTWMKNPRERLEQIHRQARDNPILALATFIRETGDLPSPRNRRFALEDIGINYYTSLAEASPRMIQTFEERGFQETAVITYTNALRGRLNRGIHKHFIGSNVPQAGTQVICLKNDRDIGLINGMRGHIRNTPVEQGVWFIAEVDFPDENVRYTGPFVRAQFGLPGVISGVEEASQLLKLPVPSMKKLGAFMDFGYALTCHKAQGSEFSDVFVVLERARTPNDYAKWAYTAVTRASQRLSIVEI